MPKRYGAPYTGSKNNIAETVIDFLPPGKRLCDLFGGGGAISHCALTYGRNKYQSVLYNDIDTMVVKYVQKAFSGEFDIDEHEPEIITREQFQERKNKDGDVAFLWSFGNNGIDYLWSKDKEEIKLAAFAMLTRESCGERYKYYKKFIRLLNNRSTDNKLESLERIQALERMTFISDGRIQFTNKSYSEYEHKDGDVVYCDIPYETAAGKVRYIKFNYEEFYEWADSRPYPVYFSSYEINDERFYGYTIAKRIQLLTKTSNDSRMEMIYMNKAARAEKEQEMLLL